MLSNNKIEIKWAVIFVLMSLAWMAFEKMVGLHDRQIGFHAKYTNFIAVPSIAVYVFALLEKRRSFYNDAITYKQSLTSGLIITLIITILSPLSQYITSQLITPEYFENVITYAVEAGNMTQSEAANYFNLKSYIIQGLVGAPVMGTITSAVVSIFVRNR